MGTRRLIRGVDCDIEEFDQATPSAGLSVAVLGSGADYWVPTLTEGLLQLLSNQGQELYVSERLVNHKRVDACIALNRRAGEIRVAANAQGYGWTFGGSLEVPGFFSGGPVAPPTPSTVHVPMLRSTRLRIHELTMSDTI